jgi:hypothetical protein
MDDFSTTGDNLDQADEEILTSTVSDEAIEAAAGGGMLLPSQATDCLRTIFCC